MTTKASAVEPAAYALLCIGFGAILFTHGLPKALHDAHGSMADPMASSIHLIGDVMGLPFAPQIAALVMLLETVGAVMLAVGLFTRLLALAFVFEMAGIACALGPTWPWIDRGIEYPIFMGLLAGYMVVRGAGDWSIDGGWMKRRAS
ncbi:DoxX family protein [Paucibacter sp. R3-3]|uniref:DoxX family protein n=1 Tax=Roseateles agri TaxID=3098619 RepID=A0ABU5DIW8_9BURK|nr:DoxX family protein [Paucibacter sp. R3-3]MDY0746242.1 DoxX family protein [Paucibacter sp. R3-3]